LLRASFTFIQKMYNISRRANIGATALCAAMQPLGLMRTITTILCTLGDSPASDIDTVLHNYIKFLGIIIHTPRMAVWIAEGLKHGLLRAILVCADRNSGGTSHTLLRDLLNETLNPSLTVTAKMMFPTKLGNSHQSHSFCRRSLKDIWRQRRLELLPEIVRVLLS
jgi:hypothetical protein